MSDNIKENINSKRKRDKLSLETYALDMDNNFDRPVNEIIKDLKIRQEKEYSDHNHWLDIESNDPEKFEKIEEIANKKGHSIYHQMFEYIQSAKYLEDELLALYEMKITYAFKHLEIKMKNLISTAFNDKSVTKSYNWDKLIQYLKIKNINLKELNSYSEINQLRILNNSIKHSNNGLDDSLKSIPEFRTNSRHDYETIEKFYERIEMCSFEFIQSLSTAIFNELYKYDTKKIQLTAEKIVSRMEKKQSDLLIDKIKRLQ